MFKFIKTIARGVRGSVDIRGIFISIIGALFLFMLAPMLGTQAATYAASTSPSPNATLVIVFNFLAWGIPLGLGAAILVAAFSKLKGG